MSLVIDRGFRPNLEDHVDGRPQIKILFLKWAMDTVGEPIPTEPSYRGALWRSTVFNELGEQVALVLTAPRDGSVERVVLNGQYFLGVVLRSDIERQPDSIDPYLESATLPLIPPERVSPVSFALGQISTFVRAPIAPPVGVSE